MQRQSSARGSLSSNRGFPIGGGDGGGGGGGGVEERLTQRHTIDGDDEASASAAAAVLGETMPGSSTVRRQLMGGFPLQARLHLLVVQLYLPWLYLPCST